jgi:predicted ATPase/class 3 adenylate cyclase
MTELPTGRITFLFSDIEGSTRLWERLPDAMAVALRRHDELLRMSVEAAGGVVFKTVGDAFCVAFGDSVAAVTAAVAAQRAVASEPWPPGVELRVRMALHTGTTEEREGDYFGPALNRVARLVAAAHGGQILLTAATATEVAGRLGTGTEVRSLGAHELVDIDGREDIHQVLAAGLRTEFPPVRVRPLSLQTSNLPADRSSFVERAAEVEEIFRLLRTGRLVTLTGSGGVGKTRLATEVARGLVGSTADGVWLVELADVTDPASVALAVRESLEFAEQPGRSDLSVLLETLREQQRVLVVDNCEHVVDAAAALLSAISEACPRITILATSREPLRVDGEVLYRVPPLSLPPRDATSLADLAGSGAVALFLERARGQDPHFEVDPASVGAVASICHRLDGIPLALELAAARLGTMSVAELDEGLDRLFGVLTKGSRAALARHQTLRALIDWSYDLLDADEQGMLRRLSAFQDGFDLEAAASVWCVDHPDAEPLELVASLVDKSLVVATRDGQRTRYRMLESLRQFGAERLASPDGAGHGDGAGDGDDGGADGEARLVARAHSRHYVELFERVEPHLFGADAPTWVARARADQENFRLAVAELVAGPEADPASAALALRLFGAVASCASSFREHVTLLALLDRALAMAPPDAEGPRATALYCKARFLMYRQQEGLRESLGDAVDTAREADLPNVEAAALGYLSLVTRAPDLAEQAVDVARARGDGYALALALNLYGTTVLHTDRARGGALLREALDAALRCGNAELEGMCRVTLGCEEVQDGRLDLAEAHFARLDRLFATAAPPMSLYSAFEVNLGWLRVAQEDWLSAQACFFESLRLARLSGASHLLGYGLLGLGCCARAAGSLEYAVTLHSGANAAMERWGTAWEPMEGATCARNLDELAVEVGARFPVLYAEATATPTDELVAAVLAR